MFYVKWTAVLIHELMTHLITLVNLMSIVIIFWLSIPFSVGLCPSVGLRDGHFMCASQPLSLIKYVFLLKDIIFSLLWGCTRLGFHSELAYLSLFNFRICVQCKSRAWSVKINVTAVGRKWADVKDFPLIILIIEHCHCGHQAVSQVLFYFNHQVRGHC